VLTRVALWLLLLTAAGAAPLAAQPGRVGRAPQPDPAWRPITVRYSLLEDDPTLSIDPGRIARLEFVTRVPTPRAALACGLVLSERGWREPQFCRVIREEGRDDSVVRHAIAIDLARLEEGCGDFDPRLRETHGGTIEAALEIHDPRLQQGNALPLRFAYRDARRVPCLSDGPWWDLVDGTRGVVSWGTDLPAAGVLRYQSGGTRRTLRLPEETRQRVELTGLAPGVACRYEITFGPDSLEEGPFSFTPPRPEDPFLFAVLGDSRSGRGPGDTRTNGVNLRVLRALCRDADARGAAFLLFSGDLADGIATVPGDIRRQWETWKRGADPIARRLPVYETPGNHESCERIFGDSIPRVSFDGEGGASVEAMFTRMFAGPANGPARESADAPEYGSTAYSFRWGRALFLVLNSNYWVSSDPEAWGGNLAGYIMDGQMEWAEARLREAAADTGVAHVFVLLHDPPFPCGGHADGAMWYAGGRPQENGAIDRGYVVARRDRLWRAIAGCAKARALFAGHEHNYSRLLVSATTPVHLDGSGDPGFTHPVWQCVSGGCGAPSYARGDAVPWAGGIAAFSMVSHYLLIGVDGGDVALFAVAETGEEIDGRLLAEDGRVADRPITLAAWRARR
jgi:hypothetical protein